MGIVDEVLDVFPFDGPERVVQRREELLLGEPVARGPKMWQDMAPLEAVHFSPVFEEVGLARPRSVYESNHLRVEWQTMNYRQPFYHRNTDVDEMSYQIGGERTLMTELGSVEHRPGDFSRIPRGVAHDNYGREQTHMLFYVPAPVRELLPPVRSSTLRMPPFPGWEAAPNNELMTECLGGPEHDVAISAIDEQMLLEQAHSEGGRVAVSHPDEDIAGVHWVFRGADVMIGRTNLAATQGRRFRRHLDAQEVQFQVEGRRTLVSQRGTLNLEPGDLALIPSGTAFTSISPEPSSYITLVTRIAVNRIAEVAKKAEPVTPDVLEQLRG